MRQTLLTIAFAALAAIAGAAQAQGAISPAKVPEEMRNKQNLYLLPKEAHQFVKSQKGKVLFLDVRTRAEAQFLGMADGVDALVPYVEFQDFMTDWDNTRGFYKLEPFNDFVPEVERRLKEKGLPKDTPVSMR